MRSANRASVSLALAAGVGLLICGCTTTQTTAARLQLNDERLRAEAEAVRVGPGETSATVTVTSETFLAQGGALTAAVTLDNHGDAAVSDLPISLGYEHAGHTVYLNGAEGSTYFDDHIPSIKAHGSLTWIFTANRKVPRDAQTFVRVGAKPSIAVGPISTPVIRVASSVVPSRRLSKRPSNGLVTTPSLRISVTNTSSITQYQLPVYTVLTHGGRVVAANHHTVADLAAGARAVIDVSFDPTGSGTRTVQVEAPATIFK